MMQALHQRQVRLAAMTDKGAQRKLMVRYGYSLEQNWKPEGLYF